MPEAGIIVEPGGRLIIDGGKLTNEFYHNTFWRGIQVWGNSSEHQFPYNPTHQGLVVLKNDAVIEHAREGIQLWNPWDFNSTGGVVRVEGTNTQVGGTFLNCRRAVTFMAYQGTIPGGGATDNRSYFTNAHFLVDSNYLGGDDFYAHVSLWQVKGVSFNGCTFKNLQTNITESAKLGMGILSMDAHYRVKPFCNTYPPWVGGVCPAWTPTSFIGLDHGIDSRSFSSPYNFSVYRAYFENNIAGVYANGVTGYEVRNSEFLLGNRNVALTGEIDEEFWDRHRGIYSTESWAFGVDDNLLRYDTASTSPNLTEGIVIGYSRDHDDIVFRNDAYGLERAYIGEGISASLLSGETPQKGLWFLCNDNFNNQQNFWSRKVTSDLLNDLNDHTIRTNQGLPSRPADNTFDQQPGSDDEADFKVTTTHNPIAYWYRDAGNYEPIYHTETTTGIFPAIVNTIPQNNCASKFLPSVPPGPAPGAVKNYLQEEKLAYGNTRYLYEQLIDGGNTDEVVLEIQESWPSDAWDLRDYLISKSPYLSDSVLREMVLRNILPEAMVTEVLVANPEATRQEGFLRWLQNESGYPLSEYMLGMVVASWDTRTYRDALEGEMSLHHGEMTQAANSLIHHYSNDTIGSLADSLRWVWQQVRTPAARYAEALTWLQQQQFDSATAVIEAIPVEHILRTPQAEERQRMLDMIGFLRDLGGTGRNHMLLDSVEVQALRTIMGQAYDRPAAWISNLLCFGYGSCRPPMTGGDDSGQPKSLPYTPIPTTWEHNLPILSIQPNPASTWVVLNYDLLVPADNAVLMIKDVLGREVHRIVLQEQVQQVLWDTRKIAAGSYTVLLNNGKDQVKTEKLIIQR